MMKENQVKRRMYITPQIEIARIKMSCHLLEASYPGQHNPAQKGGEVGEDPAGQNDAKGAIFSQGGVSSWED
ncbi:hypothetical protein [Prevotella denticola]|jgi:hypothetical protein|nr:hypothetical protein [Prevotella denticola]